MKLSSALLLLAFAAPVIGQTTSTTPKPVVHHTTTSTAAAKPVPCTIPPCDTLAASIPAAAGTPKGLFALKYLDILVGSGPEAATHKWLTVHYTGYLVDGTKFDSSLDRGEPITFPYGAHQVITGWDTGFEGMKVGGKRRLFVPYQLAYGEAGRPPTIPVKAELVFDVELLGISDTPPPQKAPPAPAAQPAKPGEPATPPPAGAATSPAGTVPPPATAPAKPLADPTKPTAAPAPATPPATTPKP